MRVGSKKASERAFRTGSEARCSGCPSRSITSSRSCFAKDARPLNRVIRQQIENGLASRMLAGEFGVGDRVVVDYEGRSFTFRSRSA